MRRPDRGPDTGEPRPLPAPETVWTPDQWSVISQGHYSQEMEDKWDVLVDGDWAHFQRSWTGVGIYDCRFADVEGGRVIAEAYVCGHFKEYRSGSDENERSRLELLIRMVLLGEPPTPELLEQFGPGGALGAWSFMGRYSVGQ